MATDTSHDSTVSKYSINNKIANRNNCKRVIMIYSDVVIYILSNMKVYEDYRHAN